MLFVELIQKNPEWFILLVLAHSGCAGKTLNDSCVASICYGPVSNCLSLFVRRKLVLSQNGQTDRARFLSHMLPLAYPTL